MKPMPPIKSMGYDIAALMAAQSRSVSIPPSYQVFVVGTQASPEGVLGQEAQPQTGEHDLCGSHMFLTSIKFR